MKTECVREKLEEALSHTERITGKNLSLPILSCVLLIAKDSSLTIRATNLDLGVEVKIGCKVLKEGSVAVPAEVLKNFLSNLSSETSVSLEVNGGSLRVSSSKSKAEIQTFNPEEYPSLPQITDTNPLPVSVKKLIEGFKSVFYSASPSSMKPELSSVYVAVEGGDIVFAATDSFRLAEKKVTRKVKKGEREMEPLLIPFKNTLEIAKMLDGKKGDVELYVDESQLALSYDNMYITSRLIDGVFPDYGQIIPKEQPTSITLLTKDFQNALKLSHVFTDKFNQVTLEVGPEEKKFILSTHNSDLGKNTTSIDAALEGEPIKINFNYRYLSDVFSSITTDSIVLTLGTGKPMVIKPVGDTSFLYLVMPMNR